ncbi:MAG: hypothetical protein ACXVDC_15635 [Bacteroidia bacterium]
MNRYTIFVNTTDSFEDCWHPFFKLLAIYWPDYKGKIYLNTELKEFSYPGLNIIPIRNGLIRASKNTWSECLLAGLNVIDSEIIIYMQEDYFLKKKVKADIIDHYAIIMQKNNIDCIHFTHQSTPGPFFPTEFEDLWDIDKEAPYRLSCQAALWKKDVLKQYVRKKENPWQFELYGSKRARFLGHKFYIVNQKIDRLNENAIIDYVFTGIIKGKWRNEVQGLFDAHNIMIDYQKIGFFSYENLSLNLFRFLKKKLHNAPVAIKSRLEILKLKYSYKGL